MKNLINYLDEIDDMTVGESLKINKKNLNNRMKNSKHDSIYEEIQTNKQIRKNKHKNKN